MINEFKPFIDRLKSAGLRPTRQRLAISKILFGRKDTFHFTIENLKKIVERKTKIKISLATLYNTVHAFKESGYLKEISLKSNKSFFDTNIKSHHHFYDQDTGNLIDINNKDLQVKKIPLAPSGKKIKTIDIVIGIANSKHIQKK
tara:strand:+ start:169 stop:603 length:435 start_codon:yes stop_codon:yes gene_type:complete